MRFPEAITHEEPATHRHSVRSLQLKSDQSQKAPREDQVGQDVEEDARHCPREELPPAVILVAFGVWEVHNHHLPVGALSARQMADGHLQHAREEDSPKEVDQIQDVDERDPDLLAPLAQATDWHSTQRAAEDGSEGHRQRAEENKDQREKPRDDRKQLHGLLFSQASQRHVDVEAECSQDHPEEFHLQRPGHGKTRDDNNQLHVLQQLPRRDPEAPEKLGELPVALQPQHHRHRHQKRHHCQGPQCHAQALLHRIGVTGHTLAVRATMPTGEATAAGWPGSPGGALAPAKTCLLVEAQVDIMPCKCFNVLDRCCPVSSLRLRWEEAHRAVAVPRAPQAVYTGLARRGEAVQVVAFRATAGRGGGVRDYATERWVAVARRDGRRCASRSHGQWAFGALKDTVQRRGVGLRVGRVGPCRAGEQQLLRARPCSPDPRWRSRKTVELVLRQVQPPQERQPQDSGGDGAGQPVALELEVVEEREARQVFWYGSGNEIAA
mmetsp:Transcript_94604/g.276498  ORF Transcript_94604/g.276498 Transcript_94604/m.276498 type:complete len:495 (-) Transcript_94604:1525-3009(-)